MAGGTYIATRVHPESEKLIRAFMVDQNIPTVYPSEERRRHCTLLSTTSEFSDGFVARDHVKYFAYPGNFEIFPTKEGNSCLVLRLICPELEDRHREICKQYSCEDMHGLYKPHISFSYDVGTLNPSNISAFVPPILLEDEYCEPFKTNWVKE